jgi:hypothetical protein
MRVQLERLVDLLRRSGHVPVPAPPVGGGDGLALWIDWVRAVEQAREGQAIWLLPNLRLVWLADARGLLRALRMGPEAARWMSDGDHPLVGDPEDGCLMWTERGLPEIGAPPGAVLEVLLGERPRLRATDLGAWIEQVSRLYAGAQLEVDSDGWVSPRLPGGEGAH